MGGGSVNDDTHSELDKSDLDITQFSLVNLKCYILSVWHFLQGYNSTVPDFDAGISKRVRGTSLVPALPYLL